MQKKEESWQVANMRFKQWCNQAKNERGSRTIWCFTSALNINTYNTIQTVCMTLYKVRVPNLGYICLSEGVHLMLSIEEQNIFPYNIYPNIYTYAVNILFKNHSMLIV